MKIQCSINRQIINKAKPEEAKLLTSEWEEAKFTHLELENEVKKGFCFSPAELKPDSEGKRIKRIENFIQANSIWLDFDNSIDDNGNKRKKTEEEGYLSIDQIVNHPFILENAYLIYTSPSHKDDWHRFRIVFVLPYLITDGTYYKKLIKAFIEKTHSDPSPSSIVNAFYGHTNALTFTFGKIINQNVIDDVLDYKDNYNNYNNDSKYSESNDNLTPDVVKSMLKVIPSQMDYIDWIKVISAVNKIGFPDNTVINLIEEWSPGYPGEVGKKLHHTLNNINIGTLFYYAKRYGWKEPKGFYYHQDQAERVVKKSEYKYTDLGNAERFINNNKNIVRYEHRSGMWYIFDGRRFKVDETGEIYSLAKESARNIYKELENVNDDSKRTMILKWQIRSEAKASLSNMIYLAGQGGDLACTYNDFDTNPFLINLKNGIFDLKEWKLFEHDTDIILSKITEIDYDDNADCPKWLQFLNEIFMGDEDLISFIQRAIGYSLSGLTSEQCLFYCYGTGKNGKSVFFNVIEMLLGEYFQKAPNEMLLYRRNEGIPNDIARLRESRFVVASELPEGKYFNESKLKDLTGGDKLIARFLHSEYFEFKPTHKLWVYGNHKIIIHGTDEGIWRRIKLIPFEYTIPEDKVLPMNELLDNFKNELSGILKWALEGFYFWYREGLQEPQKVKNATASYRDSMDPLKDFIDETCNYDIHDKTTSIKQKSLYNAYLHWCNETNTRAMPNKTFYQKIEEKGFERELSNVGRIKVFLGIDLNSEYKNSMSASFDNQFNRNSMFENN